MFTNAEIVIVLSISLVACLVLISIDKLSRILRNQKIDDQRITHIGLQVDCLRLIQDGAQKAKLKMEASAPCEFCGKTPRRHQKKKCKTVRL